MLQKFFAGMCVVISIYSCGDASNEINSPGLIQEGMSTSEVEKVLGKPEKKDTSGLIYDVESNAMQQVERWQYEKRTIVFINDTLKSSNIK
jgi:hypothetical protein